MVKKPKICRQSNPGFHIKQLTECAILVLPTILYLVNAYIFHTYNCNFSLFLFVNSEN